MSADDELLLRLGQIAREEATESEDGVRFSTEEIAALKERVAAVHRAPVEQRFRRPVWARRRALMGLGVIALACSIALFAWSPEPVPQYQLEVNSFSLTDTLAGSKPGEVLVLARGMRVEVVLRPEVPVSERIAARAFLSSRSGSRELRLKTQIDASGSVRLMGRVGEEIDVVNGLGRLSFVVGREESVREWREGDGNSRITRLLEQPISMVDR